MTDFQKPTILVPINVLKLIGMKMMEESSTIPQYFRLKKKDAEELDKRVKRTVYKSRASYYSALACETNYSCIFSHPERREAENILTKMLGGVPSAEGTPTAEEYFRVTSGIPEHVKDWIARNTPPYTEDEIVAILHQIIKAHFFAVIAVKGVSAAKNLWTDIRRIFHDETGVWVTESDCLEALDSFELIHRGDLAQYLEEQMKKREEEGYDY